MHNDNVYFRVITSHFNTGITGDVNIDENGDRIADYSLLDMDPETSRFEVRPRDLITTYV